MMIRHVARDGIEAHLSGRMVLARTVEEFCAAHVGRGSYLTAFFYLSFLPDHIPGQCLRRPFMPIDREVTAVLVSVPTEAEAALLVQARQSRGIEAKAVGGLD